MEFEDVEITFELFISKPANKWKNALTARGDQGGTVKSISRFFFFLLLLF